MIQSVLIFNDVGKPRLTKYYSTQLQQSFITNSSPAHLKFQFQKTIFSLTNLHRSNSISNIINLNHSILTHHLSLDFFRLHPFYLNLNLSLVYRHYATLSFVFLVDQSESHLAILDLIQVFVEALDKSFKNVCELDLIFNYDKLDLLLNQIILGGIVLDTNLDSIIENFNSQLKLLKYSSSNLNSVNSTAAAFHSIS